MKSTFFPEVIFMATDTVLAGIFAHINRYIYLYIYVFKCVLLYYYTQECGGLTLAGWQVPTNAALSIPSATGGGEV